MLKITVHHVDTLGLGKVASISLSRFKEFQLSAIAPNEEPKRSIVVLYFDGTQTEEIVESMTKLRKELKEALGASTLVQLIGIEFLE